MILGVIVTVAAAMLATFSYTMAALAGMSPVSLLLGAIGTGTWLACGFAPAHIPRTHPEIAVRMWLSTAGGVGLGLSLWVVV